MDDPMDKIFKALADATRRRLLDRLYESPGQSLSDLFKGLEMSRQSVSKHLGILEAAGLVIVEWRGREKHHFLNPMPIAEVSERWIDKYSKTRTDAILTLKRALEEKTHGKK
jgi:DNA-binding transcriptional ArsR family regulator